MMAGGHCRSLDFGKLRRRREMALAEQQAATCSTTSKKTYFPIWHDFNVHLLILTVENDGKLMPIEPPSMVKIAPKTLLVIRI